MKVTPFQVSVSDTEIGDLRARLRRTRWPDQIVDSGWNYGTDTASLRALVDYWADGYDWRTREARINGFAQFTTEIDGVTLHFVHLLGDRTGGALAIPLMLLHGWPGSFLQMLPLLPLLIHPDKTGAVVFDVVVPSLPGYGFSSIPTQSGMSAPRMAPLFHKLMRDVLGYDRYGLRSSDLGAGIAARLAADNPESVIASHTGGTNPWLGAVPDDLSPEEQVYVDQARGWMASEMAYAQEHASKPQTLAHALNDSPAGLASWLLEKFWRWGDTSIPLEHRLDRDSLLDTFSMYWFTRTIGSSMRLYYETLRDPNAWAQADVPTAMLMSRHDMFPTPRRWAERQGRIDRWTETDRGGHFLEWETPEIVADDLRAFFGPGQ